MANELKKPQPHFAQREVIGSYEVLRKIATGGMGEVYLAKQKGPVDFSRQVVLKKLRADFTGDAHFVEMFLNEARIAANLAHPNIIHIYELFAHGDGYVIVMEYVRGGSVLGLLRARQRAGHSGLPYGPAVAIAAAVCDALHYAYNEPDDEGAPRHVIHRDVNPSNVLVGYDGQVKLVDFGIAKAIEREGVTQATTIKGKYGYLTPEQIKCHPLDQRSDLFSLGTMLWEMSTGYRLFQRESEMQMLYAILEEKVPRPSERVPDYPKDLEEVVMKALARSREDRYRDAAHLAHDLREVARANRWDTDLGTLSELVKATLPDDQVAFGRIGSDSFSGVAQRRSKTSGSWEEINSFASLVVIDSERGPVELPTASARSHTWLTVLALLALSAVFWTAVVPILL